MSIESVIKKASNLMLGDKKLNTKIGVIYEDNETLFCKNNVCIHQPTVARQERDIKHCPGYLTVRTENFIDQYSNVKRPSLLLSWIPNLTLWKCSSNDYKFHAPLTSSNSEQNSKIFATKGTQEKCNYERNIETKDLLRYENADILTLETELQPLLGDKDAAISDFRTALRKRPVTSVNITIANPCIDNTNLSSSLDFLTVSEKGQIEMFDRENESITNWMTPELLAFKHSLTFPYSITAAPALKRNTFRKCRHFSVDLSQMRSLRLFFNDHECTSGQLVIASRESQYKILHFHYGGLDHLAQVLHQWHCFLHSITATTHGCENYRQFMVCRPEISKSELHPDESSVDLITTNYFYGTLLNDKGQIDDLLLRKCVFFGGLDKSLRKTVWPFLLKCYSCSSTFEDRVLLMDIKRQEYEDITCQRLYSMSPEKQMIFWKTVQSLIEKDVNRIDCSNPIFDGADNPNMNVMKNILLNYAFHCSGFRYCQGMSDLLAPVLSELQNESEAFWCFVGLMRGTNFVCSPIDNSIDVNLSYLRELIRILLPKFYNHLLKNANAFELLFCHRWLNLCFEKEFTEVVVIRIWEACWSNYLTDHFHLFLCLAIIAVYSQDIIFQNLRTEEMMLHFRSLAMYMDGNLILRKARGLLHQYLELRKIPCTLAGLYKRCGPGMWDYEHHSILQCVGHNENEKCSLSLD